VREMRRVKATAGNFNADRPPLVGALDLPHPADVDAGTRRCLPGRPSPIR
jgi:hypothetical protein